MSLAPGLRCRVGARPGSRGVTLLELLAAMGIMGALLFAAFPYIASVKRIYSVRSGARQVYSELQNARMAVVTENRSYTFAVLDSGNYTVQAGAGAPLTIPLSAASSGVSISAPSAIGFDSRGSATTATTVTVANAWGDSVAVAVSAAGRIKIQ
jgi:prepilin-type N-terminal cleavage/methylation domain-containing protein